MNEQVLIKTINKLTEQLGQTTLDKILLQSELEVLKAEMAQLKGETPQ